MTLYQPWDKVYIKKQMTVTLPEEIKLIQGYIAPQGRYRYEPERDVYVVIFEPNKIDDKLKSRLIKGEVEGKEYYIYPSVLPSCCIEMAKKQKEMYRKMMKAIK